jgi:phosphatidylserine/phosphatidylglycerophosphate/cardiolipin synthase-like enzyme
LSATAHFGGPDLPPGRLRDLLAARIAGVPAGGAIDWVTYYFRDRRLAADLVAAQRRGVDVRVTLDGWPRTPRANDAVIALLRAGLGARLRVVRRAVDRTPLRRLLRPRLHEKLYCFSHPVPSAFVGSFNPSGDLPEAAPEILRVIGDHDRGHNLLVELTDRALVSALVAHARGLHAARHGALDRLHAEANRSLCSGPLEIHFWPRVLPDPGVRLLRRLARGDRLRLAASHLSGPTSRRLLLSLAARGVAIEILSEATARRVPPAFEERLTAAGIPIRRVHHTEGLPMHNKFALAESARERALLFGSFNWSEPSRRLNREIGVIARDETLFDAFAERWHALVALTETGVNSHRIP